MDQAEVTDEYTKRTLQLLRAAEGDAIDVSNRLRSVHKTIMSDVERLFKRTPRTRRRAQALEVQVNRELGNFYSDEWPKELRDIEVQVVAKEIAWNERLLEDASGEKVVAARPEAVVAAAQRRTYQGHTFAYHTKKAFRSESARVNKALRTGYLGGKNIQEMTRDVVGVLGRSDRDVRTITRSYFMHNATEAKSTVIEKNPGLVEALIWISTLDARTTPLICGVRDQQLYTLDHDPIEHGLLWDAGPGRIHWNCRSSYAPKIKGVDPGQTPRPSVGAGRNYERGDNRTRTGRVRKPNKREREKGVYSVQMRTTRSKYEGWLREQSRKNIDFAADVLGSKAAARAFRDGQATLSSLGALSPVANPLQRNLI